MTDIELLRSLRIPTADEPLRILTSACFTGVECGWDGTNNGQFPHIQVLFNKQNVRIFKFCPEDYAYGSPREMSDIHGGNGFDVLDGKARVLAESGIDWTEGMLRSTAAMRDYALEHSVELAILMDMSAACGSQVISDGSRFATDRKYQKGPGLAAAQLLRAGIPVISNRDYASLEVLYAKIDPHHIINKAAIDHHESQWYKEYFSIV